jgi:hypothetical protein
MPNGIVAAMTRSASTVTIVLPRNFRKPATLLKVWLILHNPFQWEIFAQTFSRQDCSLLA